MTTQTNGWNTHTHTHAQTYIENEARRKKNVKSTSLTHFY